ncbi:hypothetical protein KHA80_18410 [Anaerobacillus sp. HL2]|nr:hypothetical protein KHA80_18410 [Anaerobacillus sp. HL2]
MGLAKRQIMKDIFKKLEIDEKEFPFDQALAQISFWKKRTLLPSKNQAGMIGKKKSSLYMRAMKKETINRSIDFDIHASRLLSAFN